MKNCKCTFSNIVSKNSQFDSLSLLRKSSNWYFIQIRAYSCLTLNVSYIGLLSGYLVVKGCIKVLYEAKYAGSESFESL